MIMKQTIASFKSDMKRLKVALLTQYNTGVELCDYLYTLSLVMDSIDVFLRYAVTIIYKSTLERLLNSLVV